MKNKIYSFMILLFLSASNSDSQNSPVWTRDINALPDSVAHVYPVRTMNDAANNIYVLSTYVNNSFPLLNKICLNKYYETGALLWSLIFDNNGNGTVRPFDFAVDNAGNSYIVAELYYLTGNPRPLILKVSPGGNILWQRDSTTAFNVGSYEQVILKNNLLYLSSGSGVAVFDTNGTEQWSHAVTADRMTVDNAGRMIVSGYFSGSINLHGYDAAGNLNFSDSTIYAKKMASDYDDSFYLLTDYGSAGYELVKFDSSGIFQWSSSAFPVPPPSFGDIGLEVLVDYNNDVIVVGVNDTIVKLSPSGNVIWTKPMNGLDTYLLSAEITFSNLIAVAGSIADSSGNGYDIQVSLLDLSGNQNWQGYYNGNAAGQEFSVDMTIDNSGIYVIENNDNNTTLVKFAAPFLSPVDYSLVCVDSVWYDTIFPNFINVRVFNGNPSHLNYPSVQIVSPANDTIGNPQNMGSFFAHLGNTYQTYNDTITQTGITDFSSYTFLISVSGDTTVVITWCGPVAVPELTENEMRIFPNPVHDVLFIVSPQGKNFSAEIYNVLGEKVYERKLSAEQFQAVDVSALTNGIYFLRLETEKGIATAKFVKQ